MPLFITRMRNFSIGGEWLLSMLTLILWANQGCMMFFFFFFPADTDN